MFVLARDTIHKCLIKDIWRTSLLTHLNVYYLGLCLCSTPTHDNRRLSARILFNLITNDWPPPKIRIYIYVICVGSLRFSKLLSILLRYIRIYTVGSNVLTKKKPRTRFDLHNITVSRCFRHVRIAYIIGTPVIVCDGRRFTGMPKYGLIFTPRMKYGTKVYEIRNRFSSFCRTLFFASLTSTQQSCQPSPLNR